MSHRCKQFIIYSVSVLKLRQKSIRNFPAGGREKSYLSHDEEGYLCPCEAANKKPGLWHVVYVVQCCACKQIDVVIKLETAIHQSYVSLT